jgi:argininosuccinate lyase
VPFRHAHGVVGRLVAEAESKGVELRDLSLGELQAESNAIEQDVYDYLGAERVVQRYISQGSAGAESVKNQIRQWEERLGSS